MRRKHGGVSEIATGHLGARARRVRPSKLDVVFVRAPALGDTVELAVESGAGCCRGCGWRQQRMGAPRQNEADTCIGAGKGRWAQITLPVVITAPPIIRAQIFSTQVTRLTGTHFYGATVEPKSFVRATGSWRWSFIESTQVCRRQDTFGSARRKRYEPSAVQTSVTSFLIQRPRCSVHPITPNLAGDNGGISPWRGSYIDGLTNPVRAGGCFDSYDSDEVCPPGSSIEHHSIRRRCVAFIRWVSPTAVISTPLSDPAVRY